MGRHHTAIRDEPEINYRINSSLECGPIDDKSVRKSALAPACLRILRYRIQLQPAGPVLVHGRELSPADARQWRRLPVPGLPAEIGGGGRQRRAAMTARWNVSAVLLDMDGTLLDTEKVYFESLVSALHSCGYTDGVMALCHAMVGLPGPECEAMLVDRYGEGFPLAEINKTFVAKRDELFRAGLPLKNGTIELLDALQAAQCPMAIVTSSSRRSASHPRRNPRAFRIDPDPRRRQAWQAESRSVSAGGRAARPPATRLRRRRRFQPRRHRSPRRRRHHHHGAGHGATDGRVARAVRGGCERPECRG
jgi:hypothetical protein